MDQKVSVNVFGRTVTVKLCEMEDGDLGEYFPDKHEIHLNRNLSAEQLPAVLLHEIFHAVFDRIGFYSAGISIEIEEIIVDTLSTAVAENFKIILR